MYIISFPIMKKQQKKPSCYSLYVFMLKLTASVSPNMVTKQEYANASIF